MFLRRRIVQTFSVGLLIAIPIINNYGFHTIIGNLSSLRIMGYSLTMPLEAIEALIGTQSGNYSPILISMIIPVLITMLLGPVFCSWVCPQNTFSELGDTLYRKTHKRKNRRPRKAIFFFIPFLLIPIILVLDKMLQVTIFTVFHPAAIFARTCLSALFLHVVCIDMVLIGIILLVEIFGIRRFWCRYVCPLGALLALIGAGRIFRTNFQKDHCNDCGSCIDFCQFGNDPRKQSIRCRNCGACVSKCDKGALKQAFTPLIAFRKNFGKNKIPSKSIRMILLITSFTITIQIADLQSTGFALERTFIRALYIPVADNYTGIVAFEKYRDKMVYADFSLERMASWPELRAYFSSGEIDIAFITSPLAMDMFLEDPGFRCISLMHRGGGAMAINDHLNTYAGLPSGRLKRKPDSKVAEAFAKANLELGRPSKCAVSSVFSIDNVVLYKYLKDFGKTLAFRNDKTADVITYPVDPIKSPFFIKKKNSRAIPASFVQSLPWADVVEADHFGYVAWYSKDVLIWPDGHVGAIAIATDDCIKNKKQALSETIKYLHRAGQDIEDARIKGGDRMADIIDMIRRHVPEHNEEAITHSLRPDLNAINYRNLNVDRDGLQMIMDIALEAEILKKSIDIDGFVDESFSTNE